MKLLENCLISSYHIEKSLKLWHLFKAFYLCFGQSNTQNRSTLLRFNFFRFSFLQVSKSTKLEKQKQFSLSSQHKTDFNPFEVKWCYPHTKGQANLQNTCSKVKQSRANFPTANTKLTFNCPYFAPNFGTLY